MTIHQRLSLAERFLAEGRYAACLRLVGPLTTKAPRTADELAAQRLLAKAAYAVGRLAVAEQAARRVIRRRPKDEAMMRLLVRVLQREGRHRDAAELMSRLDALGTDTWDDDAASGEVAQPVAEEPKRRSSRSRRAA
ncbi:MAG TPA: hypothetical protein PK868_02480 [Phycicoccus sp.]|jgi:predicted Zn-dependent protease|nr:hypothetical protein [Phycicoccus sp.]HQK30824.1 hypothetical protein [Phycicoccus sp.]HQY95938.1 hypothetical protein [Phycicoccus sp.]